jgi:hypothetical protein
MNMAGPVAQPDLPQLLRLASAYCKDFGRDELS